MSQFDAKVQENPGYNTVRLFSDYHFIREFGILNLDGGEKFYRETQDSEFGLLILEGSCVVETEDKDFGEIESREHVFSGLPVAVYVPAQSHFTVHSGKKAKIAVCGGACGEKTRSALITPDQIKVMKIGRDNWSRDVRLVIGPDSPSVNMLLGETLNPPGNWSGIPPSKHEHNNLPTESRHEELYYFRTEHPQGWGIERIYSPERKINEYVHLNHGVVTFMPWGYHEVVAAPGYNLYYTFFLAGEGKKLAQLEDPEHKWLKEGKL
jgi:5-deoxy-glucuronate isomerase